MLVLSRKKDQQIFIAGGISVKVLQVKGNTVRLGIEAPREIHVRRGELPPLESWEEDSGEAPAPPTISMADRLRQMRDRP